MKKSEAAMQWAELCQKVKEAPEAFELIRPDGVKKFCDDIRELDERTTKAYVDAKNYYVR